MARPRLINGPRHAESNAAHNLAIVKKSLEDQLAKANKALEKAKADVARITTSLDAGRDALAVAEERLAAVERSRRMSSKVVASEWLPITRLP